MKRQVGMHIAGNFNARFTKGLTLHRTSLRLSHLPIIITIIIIIIIIIFKSHLHEEIGWHAYRWKFQCKIYKRINVISGH
jgi:hypothetical protein